MIPFRWKQSLLLWLSLPYAAGIYTRFTCSISWTTIAILSVLLMVLQWTYVQSSLNAFSKYVGISALLFFGLGWLNLHNDQLHQSLDPNSPTLLVVQSEVITTNDKKRAYAAAYQGSQRCNVYLTTNQIGNITLCYGDSVLISGFEPLHVGVPIPGAFDFKQYLRYKGVDHAINIDRKHIIHTFKSRQRSLTTLALRIKKRLLRAVEVLQISTRSKAIVSGLLVGDKSQMDTATRASFTASGVMHIFAVSGLHVGIIYASLLHLLQLIRVHRSVQVMGILLGIWLFALVTGLHPSVCRAGIMVSIVEVSRLLGRKYSGTNALGFAALIILAINPFALFQLGFQLSFLAMLGIYLVGQPINRLFQNQSTFIRKIGGLLSISFGAQVCVAPLLIYHFHSFPTVFLLSNLLIIPLVSPIIGLTCIALIGVSLHTNLFIERLIDSLLDFIVYTVAYITQFRGTYIEHIPMSYWSLVLSFLCILLFVYRLQIPNPDLNVFRLMAFLVAIGSLLYGIGHYQMNNTSDFIHYSDYTQTFHAVRSGHDIYVLAPEVNTSVPEEWRAFVHRNNMTPLRVTSIGANDLDSIALRTGHRRILLKKPDAWDLCSTASGFKSYSEYAY